MFNAEIESMDCAGSWMEKTAAPTGKTEIEENLYSCGLLFLAGCGSLQKQHFELTNKDGVRRAFDGYAGVAATEVVMRFLKSYRWQESKRATSPIDLELKYIAGRTNLDG